MTVNEKLEILKFLEKNLKLEDVELEFSNNECRVIFQDGKSSYYQFYNGKVYLMPF